MYMYKGKAYILSNEYNQALLYEKLFYHFICIVINFI